VWLGSHCQRLYYSCPVRDSAVKSYYHQGKTVKLTICLHTVHLGLLFHEDMLPRHQSYVGHLNSMCCPIICFSAGSSGTSMLPSGGMDAGWKPGRSKIGKKSSLLSDDSAASSSEDKSTTTGYRDMTCMRRAYANSPQIGVASVIYPFKFLLSTGGGGLPSTNRVISSGVKEAKGAGQVGV